MKQEWAFCRVFVLEEEFTKVNVIPYSILQHSTERIAFTTPDNGTVQFSSGLQFARNSNSSARGLKL